jgi:hypothetical protein
MPMAMRPTASGHDPLFQLSLDRLPRKDTQARASAPT